ncbi:MAG: phosphatase PAP2 family protein [Synechococcaceae cyanobacterium]|nr:phosphatase PAP2 family protein [Synechococcaceae cyanobacterium]
MTPPLLRLSRQPALALALPMAMALGLNLGPVQAAPGSRPSPAAGLRLDAAALQRITGRPPAQGSRQADDDLVILRWMQRYRTPEMEANSWLLLERNINTFSRALGSDLSKSAPVLHRGIREFAEPVDAVTRTIKQGLARPRPYLAHNDIRNCLPPESGDSFPSGHATWYRAVAELLAELLPQHRQRLLDVGLHGGFNRVLCGVHYPSDVEAGQRLGAAAAAQIIASPQWRAFRRDPALLGELRSLASIPDSALPLLTR